LYGYFSLVLQVAPYVVQVIYSYKVYCPTQCIIGLNGDDNAITRKFTKYITNKIYITVHTLYLEAHVAYNYSAYLHVFE